MKATTGLGQISISSTEMLTHDHGDGMYAHYATAFWPGDSNFTISSICPVLRRVVTRTFSNGRREGRSDDGRGGVRDLDAL
jgi:hypothetical protein